MARELADVEQALLALAPAERAAVIDAAWLADVNRRVDEYVRGDAELVDGDEHFSQIRAKLAPRDN